MTLKHKHLIVLSGAALLGAILFFVTTPRKPAAPSGSAVQTAQDTGVPVTSSPAPPAPSPAPASAMAVASSSQPAPGAGAHAALTQLPARFADPQERAGAVETLRAESQSMRAKAHVIAQQQGLPIRGDIEGRAFSLAAWLNGRPYVRTTCNQNAAISIRTDRVRDSLDYGLKGEGYIVGLWDAGSARHTHQEYVGRLEKKDSASIHSHSTHVAGTIAASGVSASARGMATAVDVESYDWDDDYAEVALRARATAGETGKIPVSNHSYGFQAGWFGTTWFGTWGFDEADGFGQYDSFAALADQVSYDAPYFLLFKASGNDRNDGAPSSGRTFTYFTNGVSRTKSYNPATDPPSDNWDQGGYDTIAHDATAKNIMTVGAVNDAVSGTNRHITGATMTSFSSWGPADDGRIKPDIVANGANLRSTSSSSDSAYNSLSGTSMATPSAAGSAVLLVEHYAKMFPGQAMLSSMLKGLIIHTAVDLGRPGPDYTFGWGLMDTQAAVEHIDGHARNTNAVRMAQGMLSGTQTTNRHVLLWNNVDPIRATLCWTDVSGTGRTGLDDRSPTLVHDLDIRIVDPSGNVHSPFVLDVEAPAQTATTGDNRIDNVEQVSIAAPTRIGHYEVIVSYKGHLTVPTQEYALLLSGAGVVPSITHTPLQNTTNSTAPYIVEATIDSEADLNENEVAIIWWSSAPQQTFERTPMIRTSNNTFIAEIPARPEGTLISYVIAAEDTNGLIGRLPPVAPGSAFRFSIVKALAVTIDGAPSAVGTVDPYYGVSHFPSGVLVNASATLYSPPANGVRSICTGWAGTGSAPATGEGRDIAFTLDADTSVTWQWSPAYELTQSSSPTSFIDDTSWWPTGSTAITHTAESMLTVNGTNLAFVGWHVDGARLPDAQAQAENPARVLISDAPRQVTAHYLDTEQDLDNDLLPDWWEYFHSGSTSMPANVDEDGDGFSNRSEYGDQTDPRDPASRPAPPAIAHIPVATPQRLPAAWTVSADVTDNAGVDRVILEWQRNGGGWQQSAMSLASGTTYTNAIPGPGVSGDQFYYRIVATDIAGLQSVNGTYLLDVRYPIMSLSTNAIGPVKLPLNALTFESLDIINSGHEPLDWTLEVVSFGLQDDVESGVNGWTHGGVNDAWHISSARAASGSNSWYFGSEPSRAYPNSARAWLKSAPVFVASNAVFSFSQWLDTEDLQDPEHAWDGAIVEISTNAGVSFEQISPVGGYPYRIFGHPASAFNDQTPCLAGTGGWERIHFDLSAYQDRFVELRMTFGSDGFVVEEGWFVDDLSVSPYGGIEGGWLTATPTNGIVSILDDASLLLTFRTQSLGYGETRDAVLRIQSNDPLNPIQLLTVGLCNTSRRIDVYITGEGKVTPPGPVIVNAGESVAFEITAAPYNHIDTIITDDLTISVQPSQPTLVQTNYFWATVNLTATGALHAVFAPNIVTNTLTEAWLAGHGFTNQAFMSEALIDHDGDGASAWHEFVAGTDPTNALHVLGLLIDTLNGNSPHDTLKISWPSAEGRTYSLMGAPALNAAFETLDDGIGATPPMNVYTNAINLMSNRVFRVKAHH